MYGSLSRFVKHGHVQLPLSCGLPRSRYRYLHHPAHSIRRYTVFPLPDKFSFPFSLIHCDVCYRVTETGPPVFGRTMYDLGRERDPELHSLLPRARSKMRVKRALDFGNITLLVWVAGIVPQHVQRKRKHSGGGKYANSFHFCSPFRTCCSTNSLRTCISSLPRWFSHTSLHTPQ